MFSILLGFKDFFARQAVAKFALPLVRFICCKN